MGAYIDKFELPNNQELSSDDLTNFLEEVCSIFLRIINDGDKDKFNYIMINLQQICQKSYDTFLEIYGTDGEVIH